MKTGATWLTWGFVGISVLCNALAQVLMKRAAVNNLTDWHRWLSPAMLAALALYAASFLLTAVVFARLPLGVISPLMAGLIFALISLLSVFYLGESFSVAKGAGMACIMVGIALLAHEA